MTTLCDWYGISRQAHYQMKERQQERAADAELVLDQVKAFRQRHKRLGTRKLHHVLTAEWEAFGIHIGRDRLFDLLRENDLLVPPCRRQQRTTWAGNWFCDNLLTEADIQRPNEAWVSDITYIETEAGFLYLSLITDVFSRRIMGFDLCPTLAVEGALRALQMAIRLAGTPVKGLIHHSDHGVQYTCHAYRQKLKAHGIDSSMGEVGNAYDNALAERVNGILKQEYSLHARFVTAAQAQQAVREAVWLYNHERPHLALKYQTPYQVYINAWKFSLN
jgi:transposase InsO family protein